MIKIDEDGEIIINGEKISELNQQSKSTTIKKTVVIKNGKVIQNDFEEENDNGVVLEDFHNDFIDQMGPSFSHLKKSTKVKCDYCGSIYKSSNTDCPNCGANNNSI